MKMILLLFQSVSFKLYVFNSKRYTGQIITLANNVSIVYIPTDVGDTRPDLSKVGNRVYIPTEREGAFHLVRTHLGQWVGKESNTFPLRITCKKGVGPDSIKIAYVLNGRPRTHLCSGLTLGRTRKASILIY